ncbi:MAG: ABC transporter ATP-binding protein [Anaerolineaceae bacterium]|nr:ABC transporter ATP-binding protein [Anaerolineaceae bacterium]
MSSTSNWMVETHDLSRVYGNGVAIRALDGVSLCIAPGELVAVMGPSGSGKSTLLNVLGALDLPTSGQISVNGQDLLKIRDVDTFRSTTVGFIFQLHNLLPTLTAQENVEVPMNHMSAGERSQRSQELLNLVGLGDRLKHLPSQLSGGQRQRVAIARALANRPPLILADEPTGSLDSVNGQEIMALLRELNRSQGTTFVVVTHDLQVARQTDRVVFMQDGQILREDRIGTPIEEDLKVWRHSTLGKRILIGDMNVLEELGIVGDQEIFLRQLLEKPYEEDGQPQNPG